MNYSKPGQFYGANNHSLFLNGVILNQCDYRHAKVDWHYHENPYFTFILEGMVLEGNKKGEYEISSGMLLFHHWQDAHYNVASNQFTRGFHVELLPSWFEIYDIPTRLAEGSMKITDPQILLLMYNIFREVKLSGNAAQFAIDALLTSIFAKLTKIKLISEKRKPAWVELIREALHSTENWQLTDLAKLANIHPVHLSREFRKYFNTNLGDYYRMAKVHRALSLMPTENFSLTEISARCGFADQSHFIRSFKENVELTPLHYRKLFNQVQR